ncbi:MAG: polyphosphate kinase 1 [Chloroflexaceae bacterium]|nr:polyphosphate kinase 1 [Chloroflexaceae bacterium]NJL34306.1 polyphosphate kinase 1 [Chloroflexaceae bacterium]NJO04216.1 polyphosphate kinase 1 [Chloroflexaceae bacterium]
MSVQTSAYTIPASTQPATLQRPYFNRELSWIDFNQRVLEEAFDERNPLLERIKFLAIFSSNLDEFFMIRVSGIRQQIEAGVRDLSIDGLTPAEQLTAIRNALVPILERKRDLLLDQLLPRLDQAGIHILNRDQLTEEQHAAVRTYFEEQIFPVLTPLAFDPGQHPGHPFPHISNLSLNLAVVVREDEGVLFARVKVPEVLPRLVPIPTNPEVLLSSDIPAERHYSFIWLEQVIATHISSLFPGYEIVETYPFRVIRDADIEIEEDEADDLLRTIQQGVRQRRFGAAVRITIDSAMPAYICNILVHNLKLNDEDVYTMRGPLALTNLMSLMSLDRPDLKDKPFYAGTPPVLKHATDMFAAIRQQDIILHHPYDTFGPVVDFIQTAADDPNVLAIKQTLYRAGKNSPIVAALMRAREHNKQVTVLVELKARFDEENNIVWARALEQVGVHVVYGLPGLKVHCKTALVVRKEGDSIRRYMHLGTGNYNASTARMYTDLGLLTCDPQIGADVTELFNMLTGYSRQREYRKLLVAPFSLRPGINRLIDDEIAQHRQHGQGHLVFKMNSLIDPGIIDRLYTASQAGVRVDLIIRGMCCLCPGMPGLSENIYVRSIIGQFLEHSRIFYAHNNAQPKVYVGSADLMQRNLNRRVEVVFPVKDAAIVGFIRDGLLERYLNDNRRARMLQTDGSYVRLAPAEDEPEVDSQVIEMGSHTHMAVTPLPM